MSNRQPQQPRANALIRCEFVGGPLDGLSARKRLHVQAGQFPMYSEVAGDKQYVYQACGFLEDSTTELRLEFVQIIGRRESLYD